MGSAGVPKPPTETQGFSGRARGSTAVTTTLRLRGARKETVLTHYSSVSGAKTKNGATVAGPPTAAASQRAAI